MKQYERPEILLFKLDKRDDVFTSVNDFYGDDVWSRLKAKNEAKGST